MKRIWTIWGITALTGVILVGAVVWGAVAFKDYGDGLPSFLIGCAGGVCTLFVTALVFVWLEDEVPR